MNLHSELRNLIDTQDVDNIQAFINEHPTLNYNTISPNGASILWWALMPPQSKNISQPLIVMLLNYVKTNGEQLCNPVQAFGGFDRPIDYVRRGVPVSLKALEALLEEAENRYVAPAPHAAPNLATIAQDAQSAHDALAPPGLCLAAQHPLDDMSYIDQDLRGFDFSHTNLEKVSFTNCLLPIAGTDIICSQVTLTNCRLPNGIEPVLDKNQWFKLFVHYCRFCESALALHWYLQNLDADFLSQRDEEGFNVLELAIMYGKTECLKTLLASPYCSEDLFKMSNKHFPNILLFAVKRGASSTACLELLLASPKCSKDLFEAQDNDGVNILMWAVRRPELAYLEVLLASSYCSKDLFEAQDIEGQNILMYMFLYSPKNIEYFKILLGSRYCSENLFKAKNNKGQNALMYAASYRKIEHFKLLLASSFNLKKALEAQDKDGRNTLILAARLGEEYLHAVLESSYCSKDLLTRTDNEGENALMIVVMGGDIACLNMLLASPYCSKELFEAQNKSGQNALMLAIKYEKKECINILLGSPFCPMGRLKAYSKYIINDYWSSASLWSKTSIIIGVAAISIGLIITGALVLGLSLGTTITLPTLMMTTLTFFIGAAVIANILYMASPVVGVVASKVKDTFFNHDSQAQMNALPLSQESTEVDEEAQHNAQQPT
ncbi:MAG: hypothetical protein CMF38_06280 [Legionellaceae bacterium]|nr:hypothetical protein [Legionellaceae bacterium]HCA90204.1 hypothetical protein [Legionellales bacterium]|tara:strand:- start:2013 stop:4007 length:1995 start_codon:yes stop_codon:yes gene_type:complete